MTPAQMMPCSHHRPLTKAEAEHSRASTAHARARREWRAAPHDTDAAEALRIPGARLATATRTLRAEQDAG